jgi:glucosamine kinase
MRVEFAKTAGICIAVDGGGTGCRAEVGLLDGPIRGSGEAGPANIWSDPRGSADNIRLCIQRALANAALDPDWRSTCAVLGPAGANIPEAIERVTGLPPFGLFRVETDAMIAVKGALGDQDGIVLTTGTGSVFGRQTAGHIVTIGGWGSRFSDQASGARLGTALIEAALLAADGLVPSEPLLEAIVSESGGPAALIANISAKAPGEIAAYVPRLAAAAEAGEATPSRILAEAVEFLLGAVAALDGGRQLPICILGGLSGLYGRHLDMRLPGRIIPSSGRALDGAMTMARALADTA